MSEMLTAERLRELLGYDPETGTLRWIGAYHPSRNGTEAGFYARGYRSVSLPFKGGQFRAGEYARVA